MITVPKIQTALYREFITSSKLMVPNIFLWSPFESDFVRQTKSDYLIEYEIKLTKSDFRADFKKYKDIPNGFEIVHLPHGSYKKMSYKPLYKHEWLLDGKGANEFYYVFPESIINFDDVPEWCGIFVVSEYSNYCKVFKKRTAKRLHKNKAAESHIYEINKSLYYRYWAEISKRDLAQRLML